MKVLLQVAAPLRMAVPRSLRRTLVRKLAAAGRRVGVGTDATLTLRITTDEEVAELHEEFMGLPGPTDVMSFPADSEIDWDTGSLGDVVIGWPFAVRQSASRGQGPGAWEAELIDLSLHGLAHLLGHDHGSRYEARSMLRFERRLARRAAMPPPQRPYA
ncbi:MAG: rRNA maturation RNase YbeY [Nannocystales bacterium]